MDAKHDKATSYLSDSGMNKAIRGQKGSYMPREAGGGFTKERTLEPSLKE